MKMQDVEVGGRYTAKVSGRIVVVRVVEIKEIPPASWSRRDSWRKLIYAVNENTGKRITIRSAQRLRSRVDKGCEFCQQEFNRPAGEFKCPYCGKTWSSQEVQS